MNNGIILEGEMNPRQETDGCTSPLRIYQNGLTLEEISQAPSPDQLDQPPRTIGSKGRALQRIRERRILTNLNLVQSAQSTQRLVPIPERRPEIPMRRLNIPTSTSPRPVFRPRQSRPPLRSSMTQRLRENPSPDRRYVRGSRFNPVVPLQRLEDAYPYTFVDRRVRAQMLPDATQTTGVPDATEATEAPDATEANEEVEIRDNYVPGEPIIPGPDHFTRLLSDNFSIDYMRLLQDAEKEKYLDEWVHHKIHRDIHRGLEDREAFEHEFRTMATAEANQRDRDEIEELTNAALEARSEEINNLRQQLPSPSENDWTCKRCGNVFSSMRMIGFHTCDFTRNVETQPEAVLQSPSYFGRTYCHLTGQTVNFEEAETNEATGVPDATEAEDIKDVGGAGNDPDTVGVANLNTDLTTPTPDRADRDPIQSQNEILQTRPRRWRLLQRQIQRQAQKTPEKSDKK